MAFRARRSIRRSLIAGVLTILTFTPQAPRAASAPECEQFEIPVALAQGESATETVYAELCSAPGTDPNTVQLLSTPSVTNHLYWDLPYQPERYSHVWAMTAAGYATLNIDPIGSGRSTHPSSFAVTVPASAFVLHQLAGMLRSGAIGERPFDRVITVGLSNGSLVAVVEAATYGDVDGVILTGFSNPVNGEGLLPTFLDLRPASLEPRFANADLDPGYVTYRKQFYQQQIEELNSDPAVVELAADGQDTTTLAYLLSMIPYLAPGSLGPVGPPLAATKGVHVPVLVAVGGADAFMCGDPPFATDCTNAASVYESNAPFYSPEARLQTFVLPRAGHSMNFHLNAPNWFAAAAAWAEAFVGK
jgi:pimeloyl-ACP methyl ester carboxylesterase